MTIENMRYELKKYPKYTKNIKAEITWTDKVDKMSDAQVYAVYMRLIKEVKNQ